MSLNPSDLRTFFFRLSGVCLAIAFAVAVACSAPAVGDQCSGACPSNTQCETVCPCGNAGCPAYACVTVTSTGAYELPDGGTAMSCSQL
jgi:hypothetical protein